MGCRLVRGETIYFVRHGGRTAGELESDWFHDDMDARLLPRVYTRSDGHGANTLFPSVVPIEIKTFEA
jgi:hypothetical protein